MLFTLGGINMSPERAMQIFTKRNSVWWLQFLVILLHSVGPSIESVTSSSGFYQQAAIASDSQVCSDLARDILARNGTVIDAVITLKLCVSLYVPQSCGIGGGFFMTIYDKQNEEVVIIDAREEAPAAATEDMFMGNSSLAERGPLSVAVPGELRGLQVAYQKYGRLPWSELLSPVIELCFQGIEVSPSLASALQSKKDAVMADPGLRQVFVDPNTGDVYKQGDIYTNPQLGQTLQVISEDGVDAFYTGQIGKDLINDLQSLGGIMTMDDLASYSALVKDPVVATLNGYRLYGPPPPGSGAILSNIMMVLDGYNYNSTAMDNDDDTTLLYHRIIEAFKFAYAKRTAMGDEQYVDMTGFVANMTSPDYAAAVRSQIWDNRTFAPDYYEPQFGVKPDHGTSHMAVVAPDGSAVTITSTVNLYFGAAILSPSTGVILNDEMDDFSSPNITNAFNVPPSKSNFIVPGKRPVSSMCPSVVTNSAGDLMLLIGGSGGTRITTAAALVAIKNVWLSVGLSEAIEEPRLHDQLYPEKVEYEEGFPETIIQGMRRKGHLLLPSSDYAVVNAISRTSDGLWEAHADSRKSGGVSGL